MEMQKTFTILWKKDWDNSNEELREEQVTIRRLKWGEKHKVYRESIDVEVKGKTKDDAELTGKADQWTMHEQSLNIAIVKAPFETDLESLRNLPDHIGEQIWRKLDAFQAEGVDPEKKESGNSSGKDSVTQKESSQ